MNQQLDRRRTGPKLFKGLFCERIDGIQNSGLEMIPQPVL